VADILLLIGATSAGAPGAAEVASGVDEYDGETWSITVVLKPASVQFLPHGPGAEERGQEARHHALEVEIGNLGTPAVCS
jgi:hypothetical protein